MLLHRHHNLPIQGIRLVKVCCAYMCAFGKTHLLRVEAAVLLHRHHNLAVQRLPEVCQVLADAHGDARALPPQRLQRRDDVLVLDALVRLARHLQLDALQ